MPPELGITVGGHCFDDLDYADHALPIVDSNVLVLLVLKKFVEMARTVSCSYPSWPKAKIQNLGAGSPNRSVTIGGVVFDNTTNLSLPPQSPVRLCGFCGGYEAADGDSSRKHENSQQYLAEP